MRVYHGVCYSESCVAYESVSMLWPMQSSSCFTGVCSTDNERDEGEPL